MLALNFLCAGWSDTRKIIPSLRPWSKITTAPTILLNLRKKGMENPRKSHPFYKPGCFYHWNMYDSLRFTKTVKRKWTNKDTMENKIMAGLHFSTVRTRPAGWYSPGKIEKTWEKHFLILQNDEDRKKLERLFEEKLKLWF